MVAIILYATIILNYGRVSKLWSRIILYATINEIFFSKIENYFPKKIIEKMIFNFKRESEFGPNFLPKGASHENGLYTIL